jgi:hypothetical protein
MAVVSVCEGEGGGRGAATYFASTAHLSWWLKGLEGVEERSILGRGGVKGPR